VAFIGLGAMGAGMARCLLRRGFDVRAYHVRPEAVAAVVGDGATPAHSSAQAAGGAAAAVSSS
jgi:3-hydroxyisobutyrate dehydrogenase-like beta-hydroxyacid dehydrogenase